MPLRVLGDGHDDYFYTFRVSGKPDAGAWEYGSGSDLFYGDGYDHYNEAMNPLQDFWSSNIGTYGNLKTIKQMDSPVTARDYPLCQTIASGQQGAALHTQWGMVANAMSAVDIQTRGAGDIGVLARSDINGNGYLLLAHQEGASPSGSDWTRLYRVTDNGATRTQIGATSTTQFAAEDQLKLWCSGSTVVALKGQTELFRVTDATYATGYLGIYLSDTTTQGDNKLWRWQGGLAMEPLDPAGAVYFAPLQVGDVLRAEVVGYTVRVYVNGTLVNASTDNRAAFASGYPGWTFANSDYMDPSWTDNLFDNWEAQEL